MLCCLLQFRFQHAHFCRAHVALLHHRICYELEEQGDENEHNTHVDVQTSEEVEHIDSKPTVDDTEERPSKINEALHLQVLIELAFLLHTVQQTEVVRTKVEVKLRRSLSAWVERCFHLCLILLKIARTFLLRDTCHLRILCKIILRNHHSREELVLESYPINLVLYSLVLQVLSFR